MSLVYQSVSVNRRNIMNLKKVFEARVGLECSLVYSLMRLGRAEWNKRGNQKVKHKGKVLYLRLINFMKMEAGCKFRLWEQLPLFVQKCYKYGMAAFFLRYGSYEGYPENGPFTKAEIIIKIRALVRCFVEMLAVNTANIVQGTYSVMTYEATYNSFVKIYFDEELQIVAENKLNQFGFDEFFNVEKYTNKLAEMVRCWFLQQGVEMDGFSYLNQYNN